MKLPWGRRIRRTRAGSYEIRLPDEERALLGALAPQLRDLLGGDLDEPTVRRLFPTAYADEPERDREYQALVRDALADRRRAAVETLLATLNESVLTEEQLLAWMGSVNDLRLVIGTHLDVSEDTELVPDPEDPDAPLLAAYGYLGFLLESIVEALAD
jgi:hypothetical protein